MRPLTPQKRDFAPVAVPSGLGGGLLLPVHPIPARNRWGRGQAAARKPTVGPERYRAMAMDGHDDLGAARGLLTGVILALAIWLVLRSL